MNENDTIKIIKEIEKNKKWIANFTMRSTLILSLLQFMVGGTALVVLFTHSDNINNKYIVWFIAIIPISIIIFSIILPVAYYFRKKYNFVLELLLDMKNKSNNDFNDNRL